MAEGGPRTDAAELSELGSPGPTMIAAWPHLARYVLRTAVGARRRSETEMDIAALVHGDTRLPAACSHGRRG